MAAPIKLCCILLVVIALLDGPMALAGPPVPQQQRQADNERGNYVDLLIRETYTTLNDDELEAAISKVGNRVLQAAGNPHGYEFRFRVLNDPTPNAMAAAAGYVYITTGLLQTLTSEDELAAVLGHEIGHINSRHPAEIIPNSMKLRLTSIGMRIGTEIAMSYASAALSDALRGLVNNGSLSPYTAQQLFNSATGLISLTLSEVGQRVIANVYRGYAKEKEFRADELAVEYSKKSGYDPAALANVLERFIEGDRAEEARLFISHLHSSNDRLKERLGHIKK